MSQSQDDDGIAAKPAVGALYPTNTEAGARRRKGKKKRSRLRARNAAADVDQLKTEIREAVSDKVARQPSTSLLARRSEARSLSAPDSGDNRTRQANEQDVKTNGQNGLRSRLAPLIGWRLTPV